MEGGHDSQRFCYVNVANQADVIIGHIIPLKGCIDNACVCSFYFNGGILVIAITCWSPQILFSDFGFLALSF